MNKEDGKVRIDNTIKEKREILKRLEYSTEILNPSIGTFWDNLDQSPYGEHGILSGGYNEFYEYKKWFNSKN